MVDIEGDGRGCCQQARVEGNLALFCSNSNSILKIVLKSKV